MGGKWLQLEIVNQAAIIFNPDMPGGGGSYYLSAFKEAARSLKVEPITAPGHNDVEIEAAIIALGREPGGSLVVLGDAFTGAHRAPTILAAARNNVPAVYYQAVFARDGGLLSYGPNRVDNWRRVVFCAVRSRRICPFSCRQNSRWSSTSRPPRRSALPYLYRFGCAPRR